MKVSLNTVEKLIGFELPLVDELVVRINEQLGQVEEVINLAEQYKDAVIVVVAKCEKHPNADKLSVCLVDDEGAVEGVERDEDGLIQVICGAPNVRGGMLAVWLPPDSIVPSTYADKEPFKLSSRELRGMMSHGMLASPKELGISDAHEGILEITEKDIIEQSPNEVIGNRFAKQFGLDDTIIDIENKMFTHRPDCFGQLGVAREISAILKGLPADGADVADTRFVNPDWYWQVSEFATAQGLELAVFNDVPDKAPRFMAAAMKGVTVSESPLWLQCQLVAMGSKPINNIVDITNYVMLMTAQPVHAYDYDKLHGATLGVRMAKPGEKAQLLNDKTYELDESDIVIVDGDSVVSLAGIMGGSASEVTSETKNIVLEVATFDMYTVRKSSMRHGLFTDALTRFNKGQSPLQNGRVLARLMHLISDIVGGEQASRVFDLPDKSSELAQDSIHGEVNVSTEFINARLGSSLTELQIANLLRQVNFASYPSESDKAVTAVTAPFWRTDIELPEDIVEEVGRLYGFDKLPRELPRRSSAPVPRNASRITRQKVRESLAKAGGNELLTYSFVHEQILKRAEQDSTKAFKLGNALSPDLQYYRLSLLPSLLDKVHSNVKAGFSEFLLFEIGKTHHKDELDDDGLPKEFGRIAAVYANKKSVSGAPYFQAKRFVEQLISDVTQRSDVSYRKLSDMDFGEHDGFRQLAAPFDIHRAATVWVGELLSGVVGEYKPSVRRAFKLPEYTAGFELFTSTFEKLDSDDYSYKPLSRYPSTSQDISLKSSTAVSYDDLYANVRASLDEQASSVDVVVTPVSIYQSSDDEAAKTTTFHIVFTSYDRTLTDADVKPHMDYVAARALSKLNAVRI